MLFTDVIAKENENIYSMVPIIFKLIHLSNNVHCCVIKGYINVWNYNIIIGLKFREWPFFVNATIVANV